MMKHHSWPIIWLIFAGSLLAVGAVLAQAEGGVDSVAAETTESLQPSVGGYCLTTRIGHTESVASGGGYRLLRAGSSSVSPPPSAEVGCCCTYLPCTLRGR